MIQSLSIQNFKVLREVDIKLQPLTVIVGPNSSGKSSILQAISLLADYSARYWHGDAPEEFNDISAAKQLYDRLHSRNVMGPISLWCQGRGGISEFATKLTLAGGDKVELEETHEGILGLNPIKFLELDIHKLSAPSYPQDITLDLPPDGTGLSSVLVGVSLERSEVFRQLIEQVKAVVPTVHDIRFKRVELEEGNVGFELLFDMKSGPALPAHAISAGTLLTLGFLTAIATARQPPIILVDELERGLHPRALTDFIQQIRFLQKQSDRIQIIATSHSPYLLDLLEANEILLTSLDEKGFTQIRSLTEHPDYQGWKDLMAPGEFWSHVGENWIIQEKKVPA